jgi:flagellar basal body rod protein FlgC
MATGGSKSVWSNETNFVHVHGITLDKAIFEQIFHPKLWPKTLIAQTDVRRWRELYLLLSMQSVSITTNIVSSNLANCKVY